MTTRPARKPCVECGTLTRVDRLVLGHGRGCAARLGLTAGTVRAGEQTGPDLFDHNDDDLEDHCDGYDR